MHGTAGSQTRGGPTHKSRQGWPWIVISGFRKVRFRSQYLSLVVSLIFGGDVICRFGLLGSSLPTPPRVGNNDVIVFFVVGGLSYVEVGHVHALLKDREKMGGRSKRVILLSTNMVAADDMYRQLFRHLFPS